jgi:acyl CoA:acetate/3-ketoacid CoA transferase beta subunit
MSKISIYLNIILIIALVSAVYLFKVYYDKNILNKVTIESQAAIINNYSKNKQDQIKALKDKEEIIKKLQDQYNNVMTELDVLEQTDEEVKIWANEPYSKSMIDKVLKTPIDIESLRQEQKNNKK